MMHNTAPAAPGRLRRSEGHLFDPWSCPGQLRAGEPLDVSSFMALRGRAVLEGCKWDPQVGDSSTLAAFPLLLSREAWNRLADWSEELTRETLAAEEEILATPRLIDKLGLPRAVRWALGAKGPLTPAATRVMRYDFHPTVEGWRLSEVNSDVPGGFTESSFFTAMMADWFPAWRPAGDPAARWADAVTGVAGTGGRVALLAAPGYMEDQQIMAFLAERLRERGCVAWLAHPGQLEWSNGVAHLQSSRQRAPLNAVVRFYQGEWLSRMPPRLGWSHFFRNGRTPVTNPGVAVISESKRFPLVWNRLFTPLPAWRALLPETREPREAPWQSDDAWLVKSAFSNTGDDVSIRVLLREKEWHGVRRAVRWRPGRWLAQRRFSSLALETPLGRRHVCIGVFTIDGRAAGAYGRLAEQPLIDYSAMEAAVLVERDHDDTTYL